MVEAVQHLALYGYYSIGGDLDLSGEIEGFESLSAIFANAMSGTWPLSDLKSKTDAFYDGRLLLISLRLTTDDLLTISREDQTIYFSGNVGSLDLLNKNVVFLINQIKARVEKGFHSHIEYFPQHAYLSPSSNELTLTYDI